MEKLKIVRWWSVVPFPVQICWMWLNILNVTRTFLICNLFSCTLVYNSSVQISSFFIPFLFFYFFLISILDAEIIFSWLLLRSSLLFLFSDFAFVGLPFLGLVLYLHFLFIIYFSSLLCIYCCSVIFFFPAGSVWNAPHQEPHETVFTSWVVAQVVWN